MAGFLAGCLPEIQSHEFRLAVNGVSFFTIFSELQQEQIISFIVCLPADFFYKIITFFYITIIFYAFIKICCYSLSLINYFFQANGSETCFSGKVDIVNSDQKRILVVEDEGHIAEGVKLNLELQGYVVEVAADGGQALQLWKTWKPDLIVLDIMLPVIDGLSVLRNIRLEDERLPILILSARSAADDKVKGLSYGVDDYLTKPFGLEEFLLRVERVSWYESDESSAETPDLPGVYIFGDNCVDFENSTARCQQGMIRLTEQEVKLLKLFISNRGKTLTRETILEIGWGYTRATSTRTVDNFVVRLRRYFEKNPRNPVYFKSLRSVGYIFDHD